MNTPIVRLEEITIKNLKNVEYGHIKLNVDKKCSSSNLLGLYGQNGSGKTVLINAIDILKQLLMGQNSLLNFLYKLMMIIYMYITM